MKIDKIVSLIGGLILLGIFFIYMYNHLGSGVCGGGFCLIALVLILCLCFAIGFISYGVVEDKEI